MFKKSAMVLALTASFMLPAAVHAEDMIVGLIPRPIPTRFSSR